MRPWACAHARCVSVARFAAAGLGDVSRGNPPQCLVDSPCLEALGGRGQGAKQMGRQGGGYDLQALVTVWGWTGPSQCVAASAALLHEAQSTLHVPTVSSCVGWSHLRVGHKVPVFCGWGRGMQSCVCTSSQHHPHWQPAPFLGPASTSPLPPSPAAHVSAVRGGGARENKGRGAGTEGACGTGYAAPLPLPRCL